MRIENKNIARKILVPALMTALATACSTTPVVEVGVPSLEVISLTPQEMIELKCEEYGIESEIPLAIARLETGHFTSKAFNEGNNVGGLSVNEVPLTYDSLEDGVDAFVSNLAVNYYGQGLDTVEEIGAKYCPVNEEHWVEVVNQLVEEME